MRKTRTLAATFLAGLVAAAVVAPYAAQARCRIVTQSHNGTDLFYSDGAAGTAAYKIRLAVENFKKKTGIKHVKIGKITTKCGDWYMKYGLPHKTCTARARVCY